MQVVDLGELGPVRCGRCKAYMNPYMRWTDGGKTFVCNFCGQANPCPGVYFNYTGPDNRYSIVLGEGCSHLVQHAKPACCRLHQCGQAGTDCLTMLSDLLCSVDTECTVLPACTAL